jgi:hypothetical protein
MLDDLDLTGIQDERTRALIIRLLKSDRGSIG